MVQQPTQMKPLTKCLTAVTRNIRLMHELERDYYVRLRLIVGYAADAVEVFQHVKHRRETDALLINVAEFPELDGVNPPDFAPVVFVGSGRGTRIDVSAAEIAAELRVERRPRDNSLAIGTLSPNVGGATKTTTTANFARLASSLGKTLVIEADLDGRLRYLLPATIPPGAPGLFELCQSLAAGEMPQFRRFVQRVRNVDFLLAPGGPRENLRSVIDREALGRVVQHARTEYDFVFIEFSSVPYSSDSAILHCDAIIVAMKAEPGMAENLYNLVDHLRRYDSETVKVTRRLGAMILTHGGDVDMVLRGNEDVEVLGLIPFDPVMDELRADREFAVDNPKRVPKVAQAFHAAFARLLDFARPALVKGISDREQEAA